MSFAEKEHILRSYIAIKILFTIKQVKLINKKEFAIAALDKYFKTFVVHIAALKILLV